MMETERMYYVMYLPISNFLRNIPGGIETDEGEIAFPISVVPRIMKAALENQWVILGGDVLTTQLEYANANWYYEPDGARPLVDNVNRSIQKSQQYISKFLERNGNNFVIVFTISNSYIAGN